jgi:hypothetical protein
MLFAFTFGLILGIIISGILRFVVETIMYRMAGYFLMRIRIFNSEGYRINPEKRLEWRRSSKFMLYPVAAYAKLPYSAEEEEKKLAIIVDTIMGILTMVYGILICSMYWGVKSSTGRFFMGTVFSSIVVLIIHVSFFFKFTSKDNLILYNRFQEAIKQLKNGATFEQLELSHEGLDNPKIRGNVKCAYLSLCWYKAYSLMNYQAMGMYCKMMDAELKKLGNGVYVSDSLYDGYYGIIIFYSTYINPNYTNAIRFYNLVKNNLETDMEANGRRILAYYQFYVLKRPELAAITISQAEQALDASNDSILTPAEINLERKLIDELRNNMMKVTNPDQGYQPLIKPDYI